MNDNKRRLQDNTATPASRETSKARPSTKRTPSASSSCSASKSSSSASLQKTWLSTRPQHHTIDQTSRIRSTLLFLDPNVPETVPADAKTINQFFEKSPQICTAIDSNSPVSSDLCPLSDCISLYIISVCLFLCQENPMHIYVQEQQGGSNNPVTFKKKARTYQSVLRHKSLQQRAAMTRSPIHDSCSCISIVCLSISAFSLLSVCMLFLQ